MLRKLFLISVMFVTLAGFVSSSQAAMCTKRENLLSALNSQYREHRQAIGLISRNGVLEVFASEKGTWTVFVTNPKGMSCVVASGHAFEQMPKASKVIEGPDA